MEEIIESYVVSGIPGSNIPRLMKELNLNEEAFNEFMEGQTVGAVGGEALVYVDDIIRFAKNLPIID
jgi:hypothetical protein